MGKLSEKKIRYILDNYGDNIRPLTKKQINWCLKDTAKYIWFNDKDAKNGHCERCGGDVTFATKTRHNAEVRCPKCKQKMRVRHTWRFHDTDIVDFRVIINVINNTTVMLRYVLVRQYQVTGSEKATIDKHVSEVARQVLEFANKKEYRLENLTEGWSVSNQMHWFQERVMWDYRRWCCLPADHYVPGVNAELKKLDKLKYLDDASKYISPNAYVVSCVMHLYDHANTIEKLEKAGHKKFAMEEFFGYLHSYSYSSRFDETQTELVKMLKLNKGTYKRWCKYQNMLALKYLQDYPLIADDVLDYAITNEIRDIDYKSLVNTKVGHELKMLKYITENGISAGEYSHYIYLLKQCRYKLDKAYLFPKDFRKADKRISDEYRIRENEIRAREMEEKSNLIKQISDGLRNMEDLQEFLGGAKGLLVYVPESAKDLLDEGKAMHNCIGTYTDRIAEGKTLIFFVRKLDTPNAPFVAFEYCNGEVLQCRYDNNVAVKNDTEEGAKILNFVEAFAQKLRENHVLYKAA